MKCVVHLMLSAFMVEREALPRAAGADDQQAARRLPTIRGDCRKCADCKAADGGRQAESASFERRLTKAGPSAQRGRADGGRVTNE
jgi:hypothetical protein